MFRPAGREGMLISNDAGATWPPGNKGMNIPIVHRAIAPRNTDWVFAGTPGGLAISEDGGRTWRDGHLWLQFDKNTRRELGGAAYIDAYWRARYRGFIDKNAAEAPWTE